VPFLRSSRNVCARQGTYDAGIRLLATRARPQSRSGPQSLAVPCTGWRVHRDWSATVGVYYRKNSMGIPEDVCPNASVFPATGAGSLGQRREQLDEMLANGWTSRIILRASLLAAGETVSPGWCAKLLSYWPNWFGSGGGCSTSNRVRRMRRGDFGRASPKGLQGQKVHGGTRCVSGLQ
jgi:hypothetical protein